MHQSHKQFTIGALAVTIGILTFFITSQSNTLHSFTSLHPLALQLLLVFFTGIGAYTACTGVQAYTYSSTNKRINTITQTYTGIVLLLSILIIGVTAATTSWSVKDLYLVFATVILVISLFMMRRYNRLIEKLGEQ
jgi:Na+/alanine symporter